MKIIIQTPDFKAKESLIEFVEENVGKLSVLNEKILEARVILKLDKSETKENKICELKVFLPGNDLFSSKHSTSFEEAVVKSVEAVRRQIEHRVDAKKRRGNASIAELLP